MVWVIMATIRIDIIHLVVLRPHRNDCKIEFPAPNKNIRVSSGCG